MPSLLLTQSQTSWVWKVVKACRIVSLVFSSTVAPTERNIALMPPLAVRALQAFVFAGQGFQSFSRTPTMSRHLNCPGCSV